MQTPFRYLTSRLRMQANRFSTEYTNSFFHPFADVAKLSQTIQ